MHSHVSRESAKRNTQTRQTNTQNLSIRPRSNMMYEYTPASAHAYIQACEHTLIHANVSR